MIEATIESVRLSLMTPNLMVVILKERGGKRRLPVFVGRPEGDAIVLHLNGEQPHRPMTHDLAANLLRSLGVQLDHVVIADLRGDYYYAQLVCHSPGDEVFTLDARPSDAMALAVRAGCPIYVDEDVMEVAGVVPEPEQSEAVNDEEDLGAFEDFLRSLDLEDLDKSDD
ncbi:MAG: bifunctional nuclease family protein [Thermoflexales bacterium]|nr:bifunctional nuclease family protein [Thermoflexales bacterium]